MRLKNKPREQCELQSKEILLWRPGKAAGAKLYVQCDVVKGWVDINQHMDKVWCVEQTKSCIYEQKHIMNTKTKELEMKEPDKYTCTVLR